MNIQVVLLSVVLAAFVGLWSNDQAAQQALVPHHRELYDPARTLSVRPTDKSFKRTTSRVTQVDIPSIPKGIAAGTYQVVNHLGDVRTLKISISDLGQEAVTVARDLYVHKEEVGRWYFIRVDEKAVKTAISVDGPVLK